MVRVRSGSTLLAALVSLALAHCNCHEPLGPCQSDSDCLGEELCVDSRCRSTCNADTDCLLKGQFCRNGVCIPTGDAGTVDASAADAAHDAGAIEDPCARASCPAPSSCLPLVDGGHLCLCGREICENEQVCRPPQGGSADAGSELRCCAPDEQNCGGDCVDLTTSTSHCGRCFNPCAGGSECFQGYCRCQYSGQCAFGRPPENTVPRCLGDGGREFRDARQEDGGHEGRCDYSVCVTGWASCDDAGVAGCETFVQGNDIENCGACGRSGLQYRDVDGGRIPLTSRCLNGVPACQSAAPCAQSVCWVPPDAGVAQSRCLPCTDSVRLFCNGGGCCNGQCIPPYDSTGINSHCGCGPMPGQDAGVNCQAFQLGEDGGLRGRACVDPTTGTLIDAGLINRGVCGCASSGSPQCGQHSYNNEGQSIVFTLAGVCDPATHSCRLESRTSCGTTSGVVTADGGVVAGAGCDPSLGGILCVEGQATSNGTLGVCGCNGYNQGPIDDACLQPVLGADGQLHVVADRCSDILWQGRACECYNGAVCDPNSAEPDCCGPDHCVDLSHDSQNCGTCDTYCQLGLCGPATVDGGRAPGQCACNGSIGCPPTGGGGGPDCIGDRCVCAPIDGEPCPIGTWCLDGSPPAGAGLGCCESRNLSPNRCPINPFCPSTEPVLCVDSTTPNDYRCCPAGNGCTIVGGLVSCVAS